MDESAVRTVLTCEVGALLERRTTGST